MRVKHNVITLSAKSYDRVGRIKELVLGMLAKRDPDGMEVTAISVRRAKCCARKRS